MLVDTQNLSTTLGRRTSRPRSLAWAVAGLTALVGLVACDTGDGKTLPEPNGTVAPLTVPPVTTLFAPDAGGTLASVPLDSDIGDAAGDDLGALPTPAGPFGVVAPWADGDPIEVINSCDGADLAPAISWHDVPEGTVQLAVALVDESVDGTPFVHWVLAGLDPAEISVAEGTTPAGAIRGINSFGNIGYNGPCPPPGDAAHVYRLTVFALSQQVELMDGTDADQLLGFIDAVAFASTAVTGTFAR